MKGTAFSNLQGPCAVEYKKFGMALDGKWVPGQVGMFVRFSITLDDRRLSMSKPTLMNPNPDSPPTPPDRFDPAMIRVVDVESESDGTVKRFDCYDLGAEHDMFRLDGDAVEVRALDWARSADMHAEAEVRWVDTGLSYWEVDQIRVFEWPTGDLVRVYKDVGADADE